MTRPISLETLKELNIDGFMTKCCLCGADHVQWHHNFIFAHQQIDEPWCILPLCPRCHSLEKRKDIHEKLDWIMFNRAPEEALRRYSKIDDLVKKRDRLNQIYGKPV